MAPASADEQLSMPYACRIDRGRLTVTASDVHAFRITGAHAAMPVSSCTGGPGGGCRHFQAHRFEVVCQGGTVSWIEIAAAISHHRIGPATIEGGRLVVKLAQKSKPAPGCRQSGMLWVFGDDCRSRQLVRAAARTMRFPVGYAPLTELGAKIQSSASATLATAPAAGPATAAHADIAGPPTTGASTEGEPRLQTVAYAPAVPAAPAIVSGAALPSTWVTVVERAAPAEPPPSALADAPGGGFAHPLALVALLLGASLAAGFAATTIPATRTRLVSLEFTLRRWWRLALALVLKADDSPEAEAAREMERLAGELLSRIERHADSLPSAEPLKRALSREIHRHRRRLDAAAGVMPLKPEAWPRHRARLTAHLQELMRLNDIVDGATRSLVRMETEAGAPGDKREAYALLGVNPEVSDRVLKKLVEALRAAWHPDLAKDDEDRRLREERIKQINVAWDLITGKRKEAA